MPLSWSFVAFMRAWSGYHFSLADRVGVVPVVGVVVEGGVVVVGAVAERGSFTNLSCSIGTSTSCWPKPEEAANPDNNA